MILANCNMVGQWAKAENFYEWQKHNLICWGGLTAGDWQYIGSQGVIQGTYEIFMRIAERHFGGNLAGRFILTAGLGGMGGAQPLAGCMAGAVILCVEIDPERVGKRMAIGFLQQRAADLDDALADDRAARERSGARSRSVSSAMPPRSIQQIAGARRRSRISSPTRHRRTTSCMATCQSGAASRTYAACVVTIRRR